MFSPFVCKILNSFNDGVVITDREGLVLFCNTRYLQISGISAHEILGQSVTCMVGKGFFDTVLNPEIVESRMPVTRIQHLASGRHLILDGHPVFDDGTEKVAFVVTFIRDVTILMDLQKQVIQQKELLNAFTQLSQHKAKCPLLPISALQSESMRRLYETVDSLALTEVTVLLLGETGVGKDVVARRIHAVSNRQDKTFIKVDCGSIPESLIETELFGYMPGTFSGGNKNGKVGYFEAASEGTLFLDEIGELPLALQSRLLRVIQDREVTRVGSVQAHAVDVRILAATNKNLQEEVIHGRFRSDLFYRLKVIVLEIPPLRKRKKDILPLAHNFLDFYCQRYHKNMHFSTKLEKSLEMYNWPGNVRELENFVHALVVQNVHPEVQETPEAEMIAEDCLLLEATRPVEHCAYEAGGLATMPYKQAMEEYEHRLLTSALERFGTLRMAAEHLHMDRSTLFRKLQALKAAGYVVAHQKRKEQRKG